MKRRYSILFCIFLLFVACGGSMHKEDGILGEGVLDELRASLVEDDSLIMAFHRKSFMKTLDTFQAYGKSPLERISLIEYYSFNSYNISNINCLILEYHDIGYVNLFKYDTPSEHWVYNKGFQFPIDRIKKKREGIQNSPYWKERGVGNKKNDLDGDIAAFTSISMVKKNQYVDTIVTRVINNPNGKLYEMFVDLTTKDN